MSDIHHWQPTASIEALKKRACIISRIRDFFSSRDVLEVETPLLANAGVTDPHIENLELTYQNQVVSLQTSPEYHMKRLLCAGMPSIYQITKAFRNEPYGRRHNVEFTLLEWYRLGFSLVELMDEMDALLSVVIDAPKAHRISYQNLFKRQLDICPMTSTVTELKEVAAHHELNLEGDLVTRDEWLDLLMAVLIEPNLGFEAPLFVYDYPKSQASLARVEGEIAKRFEVYVNGFELANGFDELTSYGEQTLRFNTDNDKRQALGLHQKAIDERFLSALKEGGLPNCSGVALGIDRLLMSALNVTDIKEVMAFNFHNA